MLGFAARSGNLASGEFSTEKAIKSGKAYIVVVSGDASENTKNKFMNMTAFYGVPFYLYSDMDSLGHCIGKEFRVSLAVLDENLAGAVQKLLEGTKSEQGGCE